MSIYLQGYSPGVERLQFLTGYRSEASVPYHVDLSIMCLCSHDMAAGFI